MILNDNENTIRPIAFYLPQFHPIPENDKWWGKGFTEWTNVAKAKPLYKGHWQPRLPADLGFYDLRVPEVREAQAQLAKDFGIYGFCYWHYWFAGKRILERPFTEMVESGKPDFPFCIAWANQTWQGTWHGLANNEILLEQTYPGKTDYIAHFYSLLKAFQDKRYIEVNRKKLVFVFQPMDFPDTKKFIDCWHELAVKEGLNGIHFVGLHMPFDWQPNKYGYNSMVAGFINRDKYKAEHQQSNLKQKISKKLFHGKIEKQPTIVSYKKYVDDYPENRLSKYQYPWIMADWDNTPRVGADGWLFEGATAELFGELCTKAFEETENKMDGEKIVIVRSWNEWAEGNYLEPDNKWGLSYLEEFKKSLNNYKRENNKCS